MKKLFLSILAFSSIAQATTLPPFPVAVPLPPPSELSVTAPYGLSLVEFARQILQDVLKAQFVFSDDFINGSDRVGFSRKSLGKVASEALLRDVLAERGYMLVRKSGYYYVGKASALKEEDKQDFVYRPKYRDLSYLSSVLIPLFPQGGFTFQRSVGNAPKSTVEGSRPAENGSTALSQVSRGDMDVFVYSGHSKDISRLKILLDSIDTPVSRALVRAYILEVGRSETDASGISVVASVLSGKLGINLAGSALSNSLTFTSSDFSSVFSALSTDSRFSVKTAPSVFANSGAKAQLKVGSSVPTLGAIQTLQGGQTQQSVSYQDTGTLLSVTPVIAEQGITVSVEQEISDAVSTTTGLTTTPTLNRRSLSTTLSMQSGDWIILGGLTGDKRSDGTNRLPFFGFSLGSSSASTQSDIVILLQVVKN